MTLWSDILYALRRLRNRPGFVATAVLASALGIGANTSIFTVANSVLLRPLPFPEPDQLLWITEVDRNTGEDLSLLGPDYLEWRERSESLAQLAAWDREDMNLTHDGEPARVRVTMATANFFTTLGVLPKVGRPFSPEEDQSGKNQVAILSHSLFVNRYGANRGVIGRSIILNGRSHVVVGVMAEQLDFPRQTDLWIPLAIDPGQQVRNRRANSFAVVGRLRSGHSLAQAEAEITTKFLALQTQDKADGWYRTRSLRVISLQEHVVSKVRTAILMLWAAVSFLLLIASGTVAKLLVAVAANRQRELAIRLALGGSRWRVIRQLLTESFVLATLGGTCGLVLAYWSLPLLIAISPADLRSLGAVRLDLRALGFTFGVSLLSGTLFGLTPAFLFTKPDFAETLKAAGNAVVSLRPGSFGSRFRSLVVIFEVGLTFVLLVGAGLMLRTIWHLQRIDTGFRPEHLLTMSVQLDDAMYKDARRVEFLAQLEEALSTLPGVLSASLSDTLPPTNVGSGFSGWILPGSTRRVENIVVSRVGARYFETLGIPLDKGRLFSHGDAAGRPQAVIVNVALARLLFPGEDALGKAISFPGDGSRATVVGIVTNAKNRSLMANASPQLYVMYRQKPFSSGRVRILVRTSGDPLSIVSGLRQRLYSLDRESPTFNVRTMGQILSEQIGPQRFQLALLVLFSCVALILSITGVYGVVSYTVTQRRREIGVRMVLGATTHDIRRLVLRQGAGLVLWGLFIGLVGSLAFTRFFLTLVYGVRPMDAATWFGVSGLLGGTAFAAIWFPARRATRVDPGIALRCE